MKRNTAVLALIAVAGVTACSYQDQTKAGDTTTATTVETTISPSPAGAVAPMPVSGDTAIPAAGAVAAGDGSTAAPPPPPALPEGNGADEGAEILTKTAKKFATVNSMRADFAMTVENPLVKSTTNSTGRLYQKRPDKIALRFTQPAGDVIVGDGTYFWIYTPSSMAKDQALRMPAAAAGSNIVDLQAQFIGDPVKRFRYTLVGDETVDARATDILTLVPRDGAQYKSLKVWVDRQDALVRRFEIVEQSGVIRRMQLNALQINGAIDATMFRFTPPAGVKVINQ